MADLALIVDGEALDLKDNEGDNFYLTRQIHDLQDLETRNGDFSREIQLPLTSKNVAILDIRDPFNINPDSPIFNRRVLQVTLDGLVVVNNAALLVTSFEDQFVNISLIFGNSEFFTRITDFTLQDIDWSDLDFDWTLANMSARVTNTDDINISNCQWYANADVLNINPINNPLNELTDNMQLDFMGFFMHVKEIMTRIFAFSDVTADLTELENITTYDKMMLACPMQEFSLRFEQLFDPSRVSNNAAQTILRGATDRVLFQVEDFDPNNLWNTGTNQYTMPAGVANVGINLTINISGNQAGTRPIETSSINILKNGNIIRTETLLESETIWERSISIQDITNTGDIYHMEIHAADGNGIAGLDVFVDSGSTWRLSQQGGQGTDPEIQVGQWLPNISMEKFVTDIFKMFNVVFTFNDDSQTVTVRNFDDILGAEEQDFSRNIDPSRKLETANTIPGYSQRNGLRYTSDFLVRTDTEAEFLVGNVNLPDRGDKITLGSSASDPAISGSSGRPVIPAYDLSLKKSKGKAIHPQAPNSVNFDTEQQEDIRVGDFIQLGATTARVIEVLSDVRYKTDTNFGSSPLSATFDIVTFKPNEVTGMFRMVTRETGDSYNIFESDVSSSAFTSEAQFSTPLLWTTLSETHYKRLFSQLFHPLVIRAWFNFTVSQFKQIDLARLVRLDSPNGTYFINELPQYKGNRPVRMTLVDMTKRPLDTIVTGDVRASQARILEPAASKFNDLFVRALGSAQTFASNGDIVFDKLIIGNLSGNFDGTSDYTFDGAANATITFFAVVVDNAGSGSTTISIESDIQGQLAASTVLNNQSATVSLSFSGSFVLNEVITVFVSAGNTDISEDCEFVVTPD